MAEQFQQQVFPIVTLDGLSGTGKTSIASQLALDLGWKVLYSGLLYRYLAYCKLNMRFALSGDYLIDPVIQLELCHLTCRVTQSGDVIVLAGNEDLSHLLSCEEVGREASKLAGISLIREQLLSVQRQAAFSPGLVAEGRDMGRVVFPDALLKVYLTADAEVRIQRRFNQLNRCGNNVKMSDLALMQSKRDARDQKQAYRLVDEPDIMVIDTSSLSIEDIKQKIFRGLQEKKVINKQLTQDAFA